MKSEKMTKILIVSISILLAFIPLVFVFANTAYADTPDSELLSFNQLLKFNTGSATNNGVTRVATDYTYSLSGTATGDGWIWCGIPGLTDGHIYYFCTPNSSDYNKRYNFGSTWYGSDDSYMFTLNNGGELVFAVMFYSGNTYDITFKPYLIDLTQMFGADTAATLTLDYCNSLFVADYYPYNTGTAVSLDGLSQYSQGVQDALNSLDFDVSNYSAYSSCYIIEHLSPTPTLQKYIDYEVLSEPFMLFRGYLGIPLNNIVSAGSIVKLDMNAAPGLGNAGGDYLWCGIYYNSQFIPCKCVEADSWDGQFVCPFDTSLIVLSVSDSNEHFNFYDVGHWIADLRVENAKVDIQAIIDAAKLSERQSLNDYYNSYYGEYGDGYAAIYQRGYTAGLNADADSFAREYYTFPQFIGALFDVPVHIMTSMLDFDVLGFNMKNLVFSLLTIAAFIAIVRLILAKGKGD